MIAIRDRLDRVPAADRVLHVRVRDGWHDESRGKSREGNETRGRAKTHVEAVLTRSEPGEEAFSDDNSSQYRTFALTHVAPPPYRRTRRAMGVRG